MRVICKISLLVFLFLSSSCVLTSYMWNRKYTDTVRNFLVGGDGVSVVFLGQKYDYVLFDKSNVLKRILAWKGRSILFINVIKTDLKVDEKNNLYGEVVIEAFFSKLVKRDWVFLQSLGFTRDQESSASALSLRMKVNGVRYLPNPNPGWNLPALNNSYVLSIGITPGKTKSIGMVALTPITMTVDGVILLGKVILSPFRGN